MDRVSRPVTAGWLWPVATECRIGRSIQHASDLELLGNIVLLARQISLAIPYEPPVLHGKEKNDILPHRQRQDGIGAAVLEVCGNISNLTDTDPPVRPGYSAFTGQTMQHNAAPYGVLGCRYTMGVRA